MYLESKKQDGSQKALAARYGVSQATVSKCIEQVENALQGFAATAGNIHARMEAARTSDRLQSALHEAMACVLRLARAPAKAPASIPKTLPHNRLIRDGFHTPHNRPSDRGCRDTMWSGKEKMHSFNAVLETNEQGIAAGMSGCWPGSWRDMSVRRIEEDEDGGILAGRLAGKSGAVTIYEYGDKGFQGLQKLHPCAAVRTPAKKTKGKDLTKTQREDARRIGRVRIVIEHTNARFKTFGCTRSKFHGISEKLHKTASVLSGFINYHLAMCMASPENTHRKRKKPGSKTYRNSRR